MCTNVVAQNKDVLEVEDELCGGLRGLMFVHIELVVSVAFVISKFRKILDEEVKWEEFVEC